MDFILSFANWVDLVFIFLVVYFALTSQGFITIILEVIGFILSLLLSYQFYGLMAKFLISWLSFTPGIAQAVGFFLIWFIFESILFLLLTFIAHKLFGRYLDHPLNKYLGYFAGAVHAVVIFLFFINLIFALPVKGEIKKDILDSNTGPLFVNFSQSLQLRIKNVFGSAIAETLNFLTVKPESGESLDLGFKLDESKLSIDPNSEVTMLNFVNNERRKCGIPELVFDEQLQGLARSYAKVMLENGFFSHVSQVDGSTPADRANKAGIDYEVLGENLAFAPDVYLAHQGLMNSEGHRKNILSTDYGKVGIGVIDAGIYGRMFVQEFSN